MHRTAIILAATTALPAFAQSGGFEYGPRSAPQFEPAFEGQTRAPVEASDHDFQIETVASGLTHPWAIEVLPEGGGMLVSERSGALRHVSGDGTVSGPVEGVPDVFARNQGGLLDVKLGPDFDEDRMIYLTYSKPMDGGLSATAAGRGTLSEDLGSIEGFEDIFVQEPPSPTPMHYGSRIVFDGDGHAFITTGEHSSMEERVYAQDLDKTYGKVVRVTLDGETPEDNLFVGEGESIETIWALGLRNVQSAAMRDGALWVVDHGPAGGDELNLITRGMNYGWPVVSYGVQYSGGPIGSGEARGEGFEEPIYYWDPVIAPGDMAFYQGSAFPDWEGDLLVGGLVSGGVVRLAMEDGRVTGEERFVQDVGRTRDVEIDEDGTILIATDYPDGEILRITPGNASN